MSFGDSIKSLLDTYANCISLLKAFGHGREEDGSVDSEHRRSHLRKSIKADRSSIKHAYSSRLSTTGDRLRKGDARAVSALDRVLKKLKGAITNLLRLSSKKDGLDLDYQSLMSLSNGSRTEAIKAIDSLSRRLSNPSRSSAASSKTRASSKTSSSRRKPKSPSNPGSPSSRPAKKAQPENAKEKSLVVAQNGQVASKDRKKGPEKIRKKPQPVTPPPSKSPDTKSEAKRSQPMSRDPTRPRTPKLAEENRISILSFASDSTKLGEIPQRRWQSVMHYSATDPDGDEYNVRPTFPLKPYTVEVKEKRFFGLFSRKRGA
ncbi:uncharacterized protein B0H64DRAFT_127171 [Chaetomium fimeti]|jgi:hypothetical protein|uniref:Uncharacterized protein n=1 Tax=Chaetomium fimeti TaxID=1854472 RepID=A0AAE0HJG2_9PEZI|nr:hypothetical protein B0H64DRAFT_127171 [Chaetomium fimeti]